MSTTTKTLDITLLLTEQDDANDTKTRKISVPCNPETTPATIKTRIKSLNPFIAGTATATGGMQDDLGAGIRATFKEVEKDGGDTYTYIPSSISKAEIVTVTEDIIYGN